MTNCLPHALSPVVMSVSDLIILNHLVYSVMCSFFHHIVSVTMPHIMIPPLSISSPEVLSLSDECPTLFHASVAQFVASISFSVPVDFNYFLDSLASTFASGRNECAAEAYASTLEIPESLSTRDWDNVVSLGSVEKAIAHQHTSLSPTRYNISRCNAVFSQDPEYNLLYSHTQKKH